VYCRTCPDLTLIDLPGITRAPVGAQHDNIEEITRSMATKYINNSLAIIL
jgi:dynamin 1-like protein